MKIEIEIPDSVVEVIGKETLQNMLNDVFGLIPIIEKYTMQVKKELE